MSRKYEVTNSINMYLGTITRAKAERAIGFGIADRHRDIGKKIILTDSANMEHFNQKYSDCMKDKRNIKVECWECGEVTKMNGISKIPNCNKCKKEKAEQDIRDRALFTELRTQFMFDRAMAMLEKQNKIIDLDKYKEASKALKEYTLENNGKFDSSHEMLAAIELIRCKIHIQVQPTINGKRADFILTNEKIVLEIDGYMHKHSQRKDYIFDKDVREELGSEWEVIRIPTKHIEENITRLHDAIMELKIYKQKLRKQNNGILPDYYSDREKEVLGGLI